MSDNLFGEAPLFAMQNVHCDVFILLKLFSSMSGGEGFYITRISGIYGVNFTSENYANGVLHGQDLQRFLKMKDISTTLSSIQIAS